MNWNSPVAEEVAPALEARLHAIAPGLVLLEAGAEPADWRAALGALRGATGRPAGPAGS